jgi:hypothetical protein
MFNFSDLYKRVNLISEARVSPFAKFNPIFSGVTKELQSGGLSSAPYDTIKYIAGELYGLDIINDEEYDSIRKSGSSFKAKQLALLQLLELKKDQIALQSKEVEEAIRGGISSYIKSVSVNRGADRFGGRVEKYSDQKAALEMKRQSKELERGIKDPVVADVVGHSMTSEIEAALEQSLVLASVGKVMMEIRENLGEEGVDIDADVLSRVEEYITDHIKTLADLQQFITNISKEPGYELIAAYLSSAIKPVKKSIKFAKTPAEPAAAENEEVPPIEAQFESTTYHYLSEQIKKDTLTHRSTEVSVSFKDKYKPKTHWQLAELRRYGM